MNLSPRDLERRRLTTTEAVLLLRQPQLPPDRLLVSEIFGPTVQGEGANVGRAATFVRLGACSLACTWCDTTYAWQPALASTHNTFEIASVATVARQVIAIGAPRLVITGGEPLLQRESVISLARAVAAQGIITEVETAGIRDPAGLVEVVDLFTVSPKLANSGMKETRRLRWRALERYASAQSVFKFVVTSIGDLDEIDSIVNQLVLSPERVIVTAEGTDADAHLDLTRRLAPYTLRRGWCLSPRWHLILWGNERGR